jgi:hypothetical protein
MKNMYRLFTSFVMTSMLAVSVSACGSGASLAPGVGIQTSNFGSIQNQEAVPNEYIIKRNGQGYLTPADQFAQDHGMKFIREIQGSGLELFQVSSSATLDEIAEFIEYAEPNYLRHLSLPAQSALNAQSVFQRQSTANADLPSANNYIGIIDTGVDESNPALQGRIVSGHNTLGTDSLYDDNGHGTFLAGIAVAQDASQQIDGLLENGKVLPIKALDANGIGTDFSIAEGIYLAIEYGAKVIVLSASGAKQGQALTQAIDFANQNNVPIIVPAANQLDAASAFPASSKGVIAVNSVDLQGQNVTSYSARPGSQVHISAVSQGIRSTLPTHGFTMQRSGVTAGVGQLETPGAAAMQVAAAAVSIKTTNPGISLAGLYQQLSAATDDLGQQGRDSVYGSGRLNIARVSQMSAQRVAAPQPQFNNPSNNQYNSQYAGQAPAQYPGQYAAGPSSAYPQQNPAYPQQAPYTAYNNNQRR